MVQCITNLLEGPAFVDAILDHRIAIVSYTNQVVARLSLLLDFDNIWALNVVFHRDAEVFFNIREVLIFSWVQIFLVIQVDLAPAPIVFIAKHK